MLVRFKPPVLVIGIGNELRGDDAAGLHVADCVAGWNRSGVTVIRIHQLVPELVAAIADAATVVQIDAQVGGSDTPSLRSVAIEPSPQSLSHNTSLSEMLLLARGLHDRVPAGWTLGIPAFAFEFGEAVSPRCTKGIEAALRLLSSVLPGE